MALGERRLPIDYKFSDLNSNSSRLGCQAFAKSDALMTPRGAEAERARPDPNSFMHLDLPTVVVMGSFVAACSGAILLIGWSANRNISVLLLWGIASLLMAAGILCLMLAPVLAQPLYSLAGGILLALGHGLVWNGARAIDARPAPIALVPLGAVLLPLVGVMPGLWPFIGSLGLAINAIYLTIAAFSLWQGRAERLPARWPIIVLIALHAVIMVVGAYSTLDGSGLRDQIPPLMSLFGIIHFESVIFSVGTTAFILVLVRERSEAATKTAAAIDSLTGIANRAAFMEAAEQVIAHCRLNNAPVSAIMFDLDSFKAVNDTHGHAVGDAVIKKFCEVAATAIRPGDVFGRIGGEEFAVVLPRSGIEVAFVRAERIRASFAESCRVVGRCQVNATVSGGVSVSVDATTTLSELLEYSDDALYSSKGTGRNRIRRGGKLVPDGKASSIIRVA